MSGDQEPAVRLTPPPRARSEPGTRPAAGGERRRSWALALTAAGLIGLAAAAAAVFLLLPSWVETRSLPTVGGEPTRGAAEDPSQPVPPIASDGGTVEIGPARGTTSPALETAAERGEEVAAPSKAAARPRPASPPAPVAAAAPAPTEFERAMGEALAALAAADATTARQAFARALALEPDSEPAAEGLARAEETLRSERLAALRESARGHEEAEQWAEALDRYEAALALDPDLEFAREGAERARRRAALDDRLEFHLRRSDRLSSEPVRVEVRNLMEQAAALAPGAPRLAAQISRLSALLAAAETPVAVVLESDELTEVTVLRVGSLGRFRRRTLELLPGTYVAVGRRSGYRDVRVELVVDGSAPAEVLRVRCEEKI